MVKGFTLCLSLLLLVFAACNSDPDTHDSEQPPSDTAAQDSILLDESPQPYFIKKYQGTLDGIIPVEMVLVNWGDGYLSGRYWYVGKGKPIELNGELLDGSDFQIVEYVNDKETGVFDGSLNDPSLLVGTWSNPSKTRHLAFELREVPTPDSLSAWAGNWHLNEVWDKGTLLIGNVRPDSFDFALTIVRTSHTGAIDGQAAIRGNKAFFSQKEFDEKPCVLRFERMDGFIQLEQPSSNFACGFGARAYAGGIYERRNLIKKATLSAGMAEQDVFPNEALHDAFKSLVGDEMYELFAFNMQVVEKERIAGGLTVVTGAVPGLFRTNEAVIVYNAGGGIWAATLDTDATTNEMLVRYFTNDPAWAKKMPPSVQNWQEGFKDYRIVF